MIFGLASIKSDLNKIHKSLEEAKQLDIEYKEKGRRSLLCPALLPDRLRIYPGRFPRRRADAGPDGAFDPGALQSACLSACDHHRALPADPSFRKQAMISYASLSCAAAEVFFRSTRERIFSIYPLSRMIFFVTSKFRSKTNARMHII